MEFTRSLKNSGVNGDFDLSKSWKKWNKGDWIEGIYINQGTTKTPFNNDPVGLPCYDIKVTKSNVDDLPTDTTVRLYHTFSLTNQLNQIDVDTQCKILYWGKEMSKKGNQFHDIEVLVSSSQEIKTVNASIL